MRFSILLVAFILSAWALFVGLRHDAQGSAETSFNVSSIVAVTDTTPGAARATSSIFSVPHPGNINFDTLITFDPAASMARSCNIDLAGGDGRADAYDGNADGDADDGGAESEACLVSSTLAGTLGLSLLIGIFNSDCTFPLAVGFDLFAIPLPDDVTDPRASSNLAYPQPEGTPDRFARWGTTPIAAFGGTPVAYTGEKADPDNIAFNNYPEFLLDLYDADGPAGGSKPLVPHAVYGGISNVGGLQAVPIYIVTFEPGALAAEFDAPNPLGRATANLGYASQTVLNDPTAQLPSPSSASAICSTTLLMGLNATVAGVPRATNPAAGTHFNLAWAASLRDLDNDGIENALDTCPLDVNINGDPRAAGSDPDGDMLDGVCDTVANGFLGDCANPSCYDGGGATDPDWYNTQDNCPEDVNPAQLDSELALGIGPGYASGRADDGGPLRDNLGDVCDVGTAAVTYNGIQYPSLPLSSTVANGRWQARALVTPICYGATDADGDGYCASDTDAFDAAIGDNAFKHNAWTTDADISSVLGATSTIGAGSWDTDAAGGDTLSGDGIGDAGYDSDFLETYIGTDARQPCSLSASLSDEPLDAWVFDVNDDQKATLGDVLAIAPVFLQTATTPAHRRFDWNVDGSVSLSDVLAMAPVFNKTCVPVVQPQ